MAAGKGKGGAGINIDGLFGGLSDLIEKLGELAEKGEELKKSGEFTVGGDKDLKGMYGFSFRVGLGDEEVKVEPFGNVRRDKRTGEAVVQEVREPPVDILTEKDCILVVAEMPGVEAENIACELAGDILTFSAAQGERKYRKEVLLPEPCRPDGVTVSCKNGIVEIRCAK